MVGQASDGRRAIRAAFGASTVARGLSWCLADMFLAYHLHARAGLSSAETGLTLLVLLLTGALADMVAGLMLKRGRSDRRTVFAMQKIGAVCVAVALVPLFHPGVGLSGALIWGGVFRIAFSFYAIPQITLLSILPTDTEEQTLYVTIHAALGASARLMTAGTAFLIVGSTNALLAAVHLGWVIALAVSGVAASFLLDYTVRTHGEVYVPRVDPVEDRRWPRGLTWLLVATAFHASALYMMARLFLFAPASDGVQASGPGTLVAWTVGLTIGPVLLRRSDRISFPIAIATVTLAASILSVVGLPFPARLTVAAVYGIGLSASGALLLGAIARLVREDGHLSAGLTFAAFALTTKIAMAAGNGSLAFLLDGFADGSPTIGMMLATINLAGGLLCALAWQRAHRGVGAIHPPPAERRARVHRMVGVDAQV